MNELDARTKQAWETWEHRLRAHRPVRWHRLIHDVLHCQMGASADLASLTQDKWRLAQAGIPTTIVSEWLTL